VVATAHGNRCGGCGRNGGRYGDRQREPRW